VRSHFITITPHHKNSNSLLVRYIFNNKKCNDAIGKKILCGKSDKERRISQIFFNYTSTPRKTITVVFNYPKTIN